MKSYTIFLFCLLIICLACEEVDFENICKVSDPASELNWLKELIEDRGDIYQNEVSYFSFIFEGRIYIQDSYCGNSLILWNSTYFNCKGNEKSFSSEELDKISLLDRELIWRGSDCN